MYRNQRTTGLRAAWNSGRLNEHPVVIAVGGLLFAGLLVAMLWRGAGRWQQYEVIDFSQIDARPLSAFAPGVDNVRQVFRFSVHIKGELNGSVDVSVYGGPPERISDAVDWSYSQPHDTINSSIKITPVGEVTGRLVVRYRFHYH
ncbi:MAG: hypothetical protein KF752_05050 [Pirellulaceae bacterium]|nr:hypothetical protein [Pirellulaceae bacterium]